MCPTIHSSRFEIEADFKGPFDLPGVQSVPGILSGYLGPKRGEEDRPDFRVSSVSMPDLRNMTSGILLGYLDYLTNVSLP